jgi:CelD/BcsL family acetyltransferase involved in cellulose biosynthesis
MTLTFSLSPLPPFDRLATRWQTLESEASGSVFLRWTWIGSWLEATGATPELIAIQDEIGNDVALALLGRTADKRLFGQVETRLLNESGDPLADRVFIEHNGLLARKGHEQAAMLALAAFLAGQKGWQALRLSGMAPDDPLVAAIPARRRVLIDTMPAYGVDLSAVRASASYASLLSANTRQQLNRAARCHGSGQTVVSRATTSAEAETMLAAMADLNVGRHADNAWDLPVFRDFCVRLTRAGLETGSVELVAVTISDTPLGYLLNLIDGDRALNYQSAFAPPRDSKDKPGLLTHAAVVADYAARGLSVYSLLAGRDRYKQSLGTIEETLNWWRLERSSLAQEAEYWARRLLRR